MDEGIVLRAMSGDHAAFEEVAASSLDRLHALAYSILGDANRADDATQVALLAIWRDLPRLRDASRFEAWSYRILVRVCYAELRHKQRWLATIAGLAAEDTPKADPGVQLAAVEDRDLIERGFARLSPEQRAVVALHLLADMPLARVAETLGVPLGTVHSRLDRAMRSLRAALADDRPTDQPARVAGEDIQ